MSRVDKAKTDRQQNPGYIEEREEETSAHSHYVSIVHTAGQAKTKSMKTKSKEASRACRLLGLALTKTGFGVVSLFAGNEILRWRTKEGFDW